MRTLLAVTLVILLSGCLQIKAPEPEDVLARLSQPIYNIEAPQEIWVPSSVDGRRINNAVYLPDGEGPWPVWINFSPYWGDSAMTRGDAFSKYLIEEYVPRGYAVVLSAVRGTGHSEGCFQIGGDLELQDAYDVIDHFATEAWSTGNIGAGGKSYDSATQNGMIAKFPHPALKTTFHVSGISDMYRYNYREGVPYPHGSIFNTYYYGQGWHEYGIPLPLGGGSPGGVSSADDENPESLARLIEDLACTEFPAEQAHGVGSGAAGAKTDYWIERDWNRYIGDSAWDGSIFFVHGLQDWNVKPDHILPWLELLPEHITVKGWLHQWTYPGSGGHVYPMRADWNLTMLRWMDHYLKGIDTGILDEPAFDVHGSDQVWRQSDSWPPEDAAATDIDLADADHDLEDGTGVATLTFEEALRVSGAPSVTVDVTAYSEDPWISIVWSDPAADEWISEAVMRLIYRDGLEEPSPVTVGETYTITVPFYPMDEVVEAGGSIALDFGAAPREALWTPAQQNVHAAYDVTNAVLHLPVTPVSAREAQPTTIACFAC